MGYPMISSNPPAWIRFLLLAPNGQ